MALGLFWDIVTGLPWTPNGVGSLEPKEYCIFLPGAHYLTINSPNGADSSLNKLQLFPRVESLLPRMKSVPLCVCPSPEIVYIKSCTSVPPTLSENSPSSANLIFVTNGRTGARQRNTVLCETGDILLTRVFIIVCQILFHMYSLFLILCSSFLAFNHLLCIILKDFR